MEVKYDTYSVLMSVYEAEKPEWFDLSIKSMMNQTVKPNQFVLVKDGPLPKELEDVIDKYVNEYGDVFTVVPLKENIGLAKALNEGLKMCTNELVARMDSDDVSLPDRCEKELNIFNTMDVDICGGAIDEFCDDIDIVINKRITPKDSEAIVKFAKERNPFNHPTVMFKKTLVINAGGYEDYPYFEDYNLWATMLSKGAKGYNIQETVLKMRTGGGLYKRRGGLAYAKHMRHFKKHLLNMGFLNKRQYLYSVTGHTIVSLFPTGLRKVFYKKLLRKKQ